MDILHLTTCPHCQGTAEKIHFAGRQITHIQCRRCDYIAIDGLMANPWSTGGITLSPC
ncbi:MAG: hypothetical protein WCO45_08375 [Pseudanabaena sp. ELA607]